MDHDAETDSEIVLRSAVEFKVSVALEPDRVVVDLENSNVDTLVNFHVQTAAEDHGEAVLGFT